MSISIPLREKFVEDRDAINEFIFNSHIDMLMFSIRPMLNGLVMNNWIKFTFTIADKPFSIWENPVSHLAEITIANISFRGKTILDVFKEQISCAGYNITMEPIGPIKPPYDHERFTVQIWL